MARGIRFPALIAAAFFFHALPAQSAETPTPPKATTSRNGGFVIHSPDRETRSRLASLAEEAAKAWKARTGLTPLTTAPVVVVDKSGPSSSPPRPTLLCTLFETDGGGLKVPIDLHDPPSLLSGPFQTGILRALALDAMHRKNPPIPGKTYAQPPAWLIEGLGEDLRRRNGNVPDGVHAALLRSGHPPSLQAFLDQNPDRLDATSLLLYRAQALALVRALGQSPQSPKRFAEVLEKNPEKLHSPDSLAKAFPEALPNAASLSKLWTLSLASSSMPPALASLSVVKTDGELSEILQISGSAPSPDASSPLAMAARGKGGTFLMRQRAAELLQLEFRAHPLLRPVVEEYRNIVSLLAVKPKAKLERRIEDNEKIRSLLVERHKAISDYLNWIEATQVDESETPLSEQTRPLDPPRRTDPLTLHLDAIEKHGW